MFEAGRILIVDDDAGVRESLKRLFKRAGYQTHPVEDGGAAAGVLRSEYYPLVVFGLKHQGRNSLDSLKQLCLVNPRTRVLAFTAYDDLLSREAVLLAGAFDYLQKPVRRADLLQSVERALEKPASTAG